MYDKLSFCGGALCIKWWLCTSFFLNLNCRASAKKHWLKKEKWLEAVHKRLQWSFKKKLIFYLAVHGIHRNAEGRLHFSNFIYDWPIFEKVWVISWKLGLPLIKVNGIFHERFEISWFQVKIYWNWTRFEKRYSFLTLRKLKKNIFTCISSYANNFISTQSCSLSTGTAHNEKNFRKTRGKTIHKAVSRQIPIVFVNKPCLWAGSFREGPFGRHNEFWNKSQRSSRKVLLLLLLPWLYFEQAN